MAVDGEDETTGPSQPAGTGVSQVWREGVPEEPIQDDDEVSPAFRESQLHPNGSRPCSLQYLLNNSSK